MAQVVWEMDVDTALEYQELANLFLDRAISEEQYAQSLSGLPGYPREFYGMVPPPGCDLRIIVKKNRPMVSVPR